MVRVGPVVTLSQVGLRTCEHHAAELVLERTSTRAPAELARWIWTISGSLSFTRQSPTLQVRSASRSVSAA